MLKTTVCRRGCLARCDGASRARWQGLDERVAVPATLAEPLQPVQAVARLRKAGAGATCEMAVREEKAGKSRRGRLVSAGG